MAPFFTPPKYWISAPYLINSLEETHNCTTLSYYITIDGVRYDRKIIELARSLSHEGQKAIALAGARKIAAAICDGQGITEVERRSFDYVANTFSFESAAQSWLDRHGPEPRQSYLLRIITDRLRAANLNALRIEAFSKDIGQMNCRFPGPISFADALERAISDILTRNDRDTPRYELSIILENVFKLTPEDFRTPEAYQRTLALFLRERLERGALRLLPIYEDLSETEQTFPIPDNRESSSLYWVFYLKIETDDHQFWTVVDRQTGKTTTYGIN